MNTTIPFFSLVRQNAQLKRAVTTAVHRVMADGHFLLGAETEAFEREFAAYIGGGIGVAVNSGTDAITILLRSLGVHPGDEVVVPANVYPTAFGTALSGARIRLVDCMRDGNMDAAKLPSAITKKTKAVIAVHLYGNPADIPAIRRALHSIGRGDIALIEDCAQAHGATFAGRKVGTMGDAAIFSFYPSKNLGAYGDGGFVLVRSASLAATVRQLRVYGEKVRYNSQVVSGVSRMDELQAAILRVKLPFLDGWNKRRREIAQKYVDALEGNAQVTAIPTGEGAVRHLFVVRADDRPGFTGRLDRNGIGWSIHYPVPVHLAPAFKDLGYGQGDFPVAEAMSRDIVSLPMFPELTDREADRVCASLAA